MNGAVLFRNVPVLRTACIFEVYTDTVKKSIAIVRRVDDPGRIVIFKEIRRTLRIRERDPSYTTFTSFDFFIRGIVDFAERITGE